MTPHDTGTATALAEAPAAWTAESGQVRNILLLDGVRLFLKLEQTLLQRKDYRILTATSAAEAMDVMEREHVDLVLMDYVLPDATGDAVVRRIRENPRTKDVGIVIVTARGMRDHVDACMRAGCTSFLFKPVERATLCARVQEMLQVPARRHVRTLVRLQVNARSADRFFFGHTVNLSESGMLLESNLDLALGERMSLRFFIPGCDEPVVTGVRVVRRAETPTPAVHAYGLLFEDMTVEQKGRIAAFVNTRIGDDTTDA